MTPQALPFPARATDPETSQRAAALQRVTLRQRVEAVLQANPQGVTDWELTDILGLPERRKGSCGKRRQECGAIDSGLRRRSPDGQSVIVWRLP